jgi:hypothetical protein
MSRSKSKRPEATQTQTTIQSRRWGVWRRIPPVVKGILAVLLAVATLLGLVVLPPRIAIEKPDEPVDVFRPFEFPFTLSNGGYFSLYDVRVNCVPDEFTFRKTADIAGSTALPQIHVQNQAFVDIRDFAPGDQKSFSCDVFHFDEKTSIPNTMPVVDCDVKIAATFRPIPFIRWRAFKQFIFEASIAGDGTLRWHYPMLLPKQATIPPTY